ncbi:MAG TPA: PaaI family thioesterase [Woeseiaceae bacterium]|nr:PaaI family thioesterase [Woeseiaceae bacterium]
MITVTEWNERGADKLPGYLGIVVTEVNENGAAVTLAVRPEHMAPNGYLHAGTVVTLADTAAGYACIANLPAGAQGFTTIELKSNHLGTARDGNLDCNSRIVHAGRTTQVWDSIVTHRESGKTIALFRCTQLILYPR